MRIPLTAFALAALFAAPVVAVALGLIITLGLSG